MNHVRSMWSNDPARVITLAGLVLFAIAFCVILYMTVLAGSCEDRIVGHAVSADGRFAVQVKDTNCGALSSYGGYVTLTDTRHDWLPWVLRKESVFRSNLPIHCVTAEWQGERALLIRHNTPPGMRIHAAGTGWRGVSIEYEPVTGSPSCTLRPYDDSPTPTF